MICARLNDGTFLFGISDENIKRLKEGLPMQLHLNKLGGTDEVIVFYGNTPQDCIDQLQKASGEPLPPASAIPDGATEH